MKNLSSKPLLVLFMLITACNGADGEQSKTTPKSNNTQTIENVHGAPLWNNISSGVSPQEILLKVNNSYWYLSRNPESKGSQELVRLDNYLWMNEPFIVSFYFNSCRLTYVRLRDKNKYKNFEASIEKSIAYIKLLNENYGSPIKKELIKNLQIYNVDWKKKEVDIGLGAYEISESGAITITFSPSNQKNLKILKIAPGNQNCWPPQKNIDSLYPKLKPDDPKNPPAPIIKLLTPPPPASVIKKLNEQKL